MLATFHNSIHALVNTILAEVDRSAQCPGHGNIRLSCATTELRNGIKSCSVQVECKAGCGYKIEAFGEEADTLQQEAAAFQKLIGGRVMDKQQILFCDYQRR